MSDPTPTAPVVTASVRIAAPPAVIFPYFTDPVLATEWIVDRADLDASPGGVFSIDVRGNPARGTFIEVDPPHRVVFTWGIEGDAGMPPGSTWVEVVLEDQGEDEGRDTLVTLTHHGLPEAYRASHQEGWTEFVGVLTSVVETRR